MTKIGEFQYRGNTLRVYQADYAMAPGKVAIMIHILVREAGEEWEEPYADVSVNTDHGMMPGHFVVSHNLDMTLGLGDALLATGLFVDTLQRVSYGMVRDRPIWKIKTI